ncbi:hypothetical protein N7486_000045 [Penicillium sp. IBT 16267x]|nr:hypothetical protein N7486_000045 [Penicillium sp. IBT 16267x]
MPQHVNKKPLVKKPLAKKPASKKPASENPDVLNAVAEELAEEETFDINMEEGEEDFLIRGLLGD